MTPLHGTKVPPPRITAIFDRLELTLDEVKTYLKIDTDDEDTSLQAFVDGAKRAADNFCLNHFTEDELPTGEQYDIPQDVKVWVLQRIGRTYERRAEGLEIEQAHFVGQSQWTAADYEMLGPYRRQFRI